MFDFWIDIRLGGWHRTRAYLASTPEFSRHGVVGAVFCVRPGIDRVVSHFDRHLVDIVGVASFAVRKVLAVPPRRFVGRVLDVPIAARGRFLRH